MYETKPIPQRLDSLPITGLHVAVLLICGLGFALDLMEIGFGGVLATIFGAPSQHTDSRHLSVLLSSIYMGAIAGAPLMGLFADQFGRRRSLMALLWMLAGSSAFAACSTDIGWLIAARILTGVAVGAYQPVMLSYLTDLLPPSKRGMLFFCMAAFALLGIPAGTFLVRYLTPMQPFGLDAWRCGFMIATAGSVVAALLFLWLPESPRWLVTRGRTEEAEATLARFERSRALSVTRTAHVASSVRQPASPQILSPRSAGLIGALYFITPWSTVAFPILTGALLMGKGFKLSDALLYVGLSTFGPVVGTLVAAFGVDRVPRKLSMASCIVLMLATGYAFAISFTPAWLVLMSVLFTVGAALYIPLLNLYAAELFTTQYRARSISLAWAGNRLGAAIAPLVLVPLLRASGAPSMYAVIGGTLVLSLVLLGLSAPGRQRQPVL